MLLGQPVRQIAYYTKDAHKAAEQHSALYGSGPFFIMEHPPLVSVYRGKQLPFNQTLAFGQWGAIQVEFLQQNDNEPSILHELYPVESSKTGIHHVAIFVDHLEGAIATFAKAGYPEAMRWDISEMDVTAVFIDTVSTLGHFIELYEPRPALTGFYNAVANAAIGFDGLDPVRNMKF